MFATTTHSHSKIHFYVSLVFRRWYKVGPTTFNAYEIGNRVIKERMQYTHYLKPVLLKLYFLKIYIFNKHIKTIK